jgi:hypothetical protein
MRLREFNFAVAIAVSVAAHMLLWPASKHIKLPVSGDSGGGSHAGRTQVTLILNDGAPEPAMPKPPAVKPPVPESPEDDMGEAKGKGTGAESAKGNQALMAREADQDQAFLNHHPQGSGRNHVAVIDDNIPGKNGSGGQRGGPQVAMTPPAPLQPPAPAVTPKLPDKVKDPVDQQLAKPRRSPLKQPAPVEPTVVPPDDATPPPSKTASVGAAAANLSKPPVDAVKAKAPLVQTQTDKQGLLPTAPEQGPTVLPVPASSTAPPTKGASADRQSVVVAPQLPLTKAVVAAPPPPEVEKPREKAKTETETPAKAPAPVQIASAAPALVNTGDGRAPGRDRSSAEPSQQSESESDAFSKTHISAVFRDGKLDYREGRKVITRRRPDVRGLGAQAAFLTIPNPEVVLKLFIDETGNVTRAEIVKSSGSSDIDLPCQLAAEYWWIEPTHDKQGRPIGDVIWFTIGFR